MSIEGKQQLSPEQYSPLTLAYIGDAIYEIYIRTMIVTRANAPVHLLHEKSSALVRAGKQSEIVGILEPLFTEKERQVYHRGRNAKAYTKAKNAGILEYRRATGLEAVMGYLYLKGDLDRIRELLAAGLGVEAETLRLPFEQKE
ncbi:MAG: ribonuclease III [Eubacterium sp.]|jgi:ribonuclease-3 family protein|nr:ribonuclease III [Eubacterium sp.]MDD6685415.1 ribonuclease III domain-containing protein [Lachnospiraceae bacterium]MDD7047562.1 ribonuclease III domain-containing protein [Lachnospiraceae bacterium]